MYLFSILGYRNWENIKITHSPVNSETANLKTMPTTFEVKSDVCSDICTYLPLKLNCRSKFHGTLRPILTLGEPSPFAFCKPPM